MKKQILFVRDLLSGALRWILAAILIGLICGLAGGLFSRAVAWVTQLRTASPWLIWLLPVGGAAICALYRLLRLPLYLGTDEIVRTVRTQEPVTWRMAPAIFISTVITHLLGGSAGREGAALQLGGSIGASVGGFLRPKRDDRRIAELCGMAAVFSALFGTPLSAAVFVTEITLVGAPDLRAIMPCIVSAVTANQIALLVGAEAELFPLASGLDVGNAGMLVRAMLLGALCALAAALFCRVMHFSTEQMRKWIKNDWVRITLGGAVLIGLTLLVGTRDYNGGGMNVILRALGGQSRPESFLLKMLFTALTLSVGFKGGEIVPSFFIGATFGCTAAGIIGFPPAVGAALGIVCLFCGVTNAPIASLVLTAELFGTEYLIPIGLACAICWAFSGHVSLYHEQRFLHPKLGEGYDNTEG